MAQHDAIFISYAEADREFAERLCALLEGEGRRCWMAPRDIAPGAKYGAAILAAIQTSVAMVVVLSPAANASRFVPREVERAASRGVHLVAVRTEDVQPGDDLALFLSERQWIDAFRLDADTLRQRLVQGLAPARMPPPQPPRIDGVPRRRRLAIVVSVIALSVATLFALKVWVQPVVVQPSATTPHAIAAQFFAAQDAGDVKALKALFSERSRHLLNEEQWQASVASTRAQTSAATGERDYLAEWRWSSRATNYQSSEFVSLATRRRYGTADALCEVLGLQANGQTWQVESYAFWISLDGPCLDEAALQAAGRRASELLSKIRDDTLDAEADLAAVLRPLTRDAGWGPLLTTLRASLGESGNEVLAVVPSGFLANGAAQPLRGRFATVRLASDRLPLRQNLDLTLQLETDGIWRLALLPQLHPLPP